MKYISLVNLIADREIVQELFADRFKVYNIANELYKILPHQEGRQAMLQNYELVRERLGDNIAPDNAANLMVYLLERKAVASKPIEPMSALPEVNETEEYE